MIHLLGNPLSPFRGRRSSLPAPALDTNFMGDGYLAQLGGAPWTYARTTAGTVYGSSGTIQSVSAGTLPITHDPVTLARLGFLAQEASTNVIRNSQCVGATAGTPGTVGTNWTAAAATELTREVLGLFTLRGQPCLRVRYYGTVTAARAQYIFFDSAQTASNGQSWAASALVRVSGGSLANIASVTLNVEVRNSSSTWLQAFISTDYRAAMQSGEITETVCLGTITQAAAANVRPFLTIQTAASGVVDFTLDIAAPQLEQKAFPTSPIPTSGSQVSRSQDSLSITGSAFSALGIGATGTIVLDAINPYAAGSPSVNRGLWLSDGTANNRIGFARSASITTPTFQVLNGGSTVSTVTGSAITAGQRRTVALAWGGGLMRAAQDGQIVGEVAMASTPAVDRLYVGGPTGTLDGVYHIRRIRAWSQALTAAQLQRASAL